MDAIGLAGWNGADYCLLGMVGFSALLGLLRGLLREVFSLVLWVGGGVLALRYNHALAAHLQAIIPQDTTRLAVSFALLYLGVLLLGGLVVSLLARLLSSSGLGGIDRLGGVLFGVARGAVIAAVLVTLAGLTSLPREPWWKQSRLIPPFQSLAVWLRGKIPQGLAAQVNYPKQS